MTLRMGLGFGRRRYRKAGPVVPPPDAPPSLAVTAVGDGSISYAIGAVEGAAGYKLALTDGETETVYDVLTDLAPTITDLVNGVEYTAVAYAYNSAGYLSAASPAAVGTPVAFTPALPDYRFLRWTIYREGVEASYVSTQEIEVRETAGGANFLSGKALTATSSTYRSTNLPSKAFDGATGTSAGWVSSDPPEGQWVQVELSAVTFGQIAEYVIYPRMVSAGAVSLPGWLLEASVDGTAWEYVDERHDVAWADDATPQTFSLLEPVPESDYDDLVYSAIYPPVSLDAHDLVYSE